MNGDPPEEVGRGASAADVFRLPREAYFDYPGNPRSPGCTYERAFRALWPQPEVAYAHVIGEEREDGGQGIALQYWFFYYFNDADNTHEGDWEMIQLSWDVATVDEALNRDPDRAAYAQHNGGEIAEWTDDKLLKEDGHPVVYAALGSHGSYYGDGVYLMYGEEGTGLGCDDTSRPARRVALTPRLVPTDVEDQDDPLAWAAFEGRWGEREGGIWNGPTGPNTKGRWTEPLSWEDGLREFSYSVGENNPGGLSPVNVFCTIISFGGAALNLDATHPIPFRVAVGAVLAGVVALFYRDRALLVRAGWLYVRHMPTFAVLGLLIVPVALVVNGIQALLAFAPPVDYALKLAEKSPASWVLYLLAASGLVHAPALIVIGPAVIEAVRQAESGRAPGIIESCRYVLARIALLARSFVRVWVPIVALVISVVGLPWAVRRAVDWAFFGQVIVYRDARSTEEATSASTALGRGRRLRAGLTLLLFAFLVAVAPPLIGVVLMVRSDLSLAWITTASGILTAALLPYAVIGATLFYRGLQDSAATARAPRLD
jgi:hypothetical protein